MQMAQNYHNYSVMPEVQSTQYSFNGQYQGAPGVVYPPPYGSRYLLFVFEFVMWTGAAESATVLQECDVYD